MRASFQIGAIGQSKQFPLKIDASGRFFTDQLANPFFLLIDAGWELPVQCNHAQIDQYLNDRKARGFTAVIIELTTQWYSSQQPTYQDQAGNNPFSTINNSGSPNFVATTCDFSSTVNAYWALDIDYLCEALSRLGMVGILFPAYVGFPSTPQGWYAPVMADTTGHLQAYGAFLANRYGSYGNIIWGASGDNTLSTADLTQFWNVVTGMRSVRTDQLIYAKAQRNVSGWSMLTADGGLASYPGFNVNNAYVSNSSSTAYTQVTDSLAEYARSPALPFFVDETDYEGGGTTTVQDCRRALYGPLCSGAAGVSFGNEQLWGFGCANNLIANGPAATLSSSLNTTGAQHCTFYAQLVTAYQWQKLALTAQASNGLVTTSLGSGAATIVPAIASDGTFAFIYTANGFTVDRTKFSITSIVFRWFDPTNGSFTAIGTSPNTGTQSFTTPGTNSAGDTDWVLVGG